jgi:hypothetical protein
MGEDELFQLLQLQMAVDVKQMGRYLEVPHLGRAEKINIQTTINTSSFSQPDYRISNFSVILISNEQTGNDPK